MIRSALFWLGFIGVGVLSLMPSAYLPSQSWDIWDKAQHVLAFVVLGLLGLAAYPQLPCRVGTGLLLYAVAIEIAQSATGWRQGDWQDWVADVFGLVLAYLIRFVSQLKGSIKG